MQKQVNISLQVLPTSDTKGTYEIVDKAIEIIANSGLKYKVCPFETVIEGDYNVIMDLIKEVQLACFEFGANSIFSNIKMQISKNEDVFIEDKIQKYE